MSSLPLPHDAEVVGGGLGYALNHAAHLWRSELASALSDVSVTPPQFFVLAALLHAQRSARRMRQRDAAEHAGADANTASQIVRLLERRGLVQRQVDPDDSRARVLGLTQAGHELAVLCAARARALNREFFAGVEAQPLHDALITLSVKARQRRSN